MAGGRPRFTAGDAREIARSRFGVEGEARELPSDRDQNFRIGRGAGGDGDRDAAGIRVLKIASSHEDPAVLDLQHRALEHVGERDPDLDLQRVVPTREGEETTIVRGPDGREHVARMLTWLPGRPLAGVRPRLPRLLREVGRYLGRLDRALEDFDHPAAGRELRWDPARGVAEVEKRLGLIEDAARRSLVEEHLRRFRQRAGPLLDDLPVGVVHGDANDHNLLVRVEGPDRLRDAVRLTGLIDFGDMVRTWRVAEPAVAAAYAVLDRPDPLRSALPLVRGYHAVRPLVEAEAGALVPLLALRLCTSVAIAAEQKRAEPDEPYLVVTEAPAWATLERLAGASLEEAACLVRDACGMEPHPRCAPVAAWLEEHGDRAAPVVEPDPRASGALLLDFSVAADEWPDVRPDAGPDVWAEAIFGRMRRAGAGVGLGRRGEARSWYASELFRAGPEPRTVHLGVDLFVEPGAAVRAPLAGRIHGVAHNDAPLDYGPTLVLEHDAGGVPFYTLYGHLGRDALDRWRPGDAVERGQAIAAVGTAEENGGWAPHLHFQVLVDPLDRHGDFPGVAPPSERGLWTALCPDPDLLLRIPGLAPAGPPADTAELLPRRRRHLAPSLSLSYRRPLTIVRGWMQHLFDADGRAHLDGRNNVAHVGHAHPRVAEAAARQEAVLNTNTRYLHPARVEYVERLLARLPDPLEVCWLVCSGSEANELALRIARAWTGTRETIVLGGAYHGNTNALVEVSPYKYRGPGGRGAASHVHEVPRPDPYRGVHRGATADAGRRYAAHVERIVERLDDEGRGPAALLAEPLLGCAGQIVPPPGFLERAFAVVRERGGICVADEVQVGFGRIGTHFWGFEHQGVVPDVVTLGKPIGNGHPLAAVVTTREAAARFDTGMEYFNTFGGNPVSCRVGSAVLDVIEEEGLQERARRVGARLASGLRELGERHAVVGDVRGAGLFLGCELVTDPDERTPATAHARYVVERLRDHRILLGTDGPDDNVLKIKPPLPFGPADADRLVDTLDRVLSEDPVRID